MQCKFLQIIYLGLSQRINVFVIRVYLILFFSFESSYNEEENIGVSICVTIRCRSTQ